MLKRGILFFFVVVVVVLSIVVFFDVQNIFACMNGYRDGSFVC